MVGLHTSNSIETQQILGPARVAMIRVLKSQPDLGLKGFGSGEREALLEPDALGMFERSRGWFRQFRKIKRVSPKGSSYGLKHVAGHEIGYVFSGHRRRDRRGIHRATRRTPPKRGNRH